MRHLYLLFALTSFQLNIFYCPSVCYIKREQNRSGTKCDYKKQKQFMLQVRTELLLVKTNWTFPLAKDTAYFFPHPNGKYTLWLLNIQVDKLIKVTVYLQGCLASKQYSASSLNCRYLNLYIKLKLTELANQLYQ